MQFFQYQHLPAHLGAVSKPFADLAGELETALPENAEKTTALRKLLESKDCAVRAVLYRDPNRLGGRDPRGSTREADAARGEALRAENAARTIAEPGTAAAFDEATGTEREAGSP